MRTPLSKNTKADKGPKRGGSSRLGLEANGDGRGLVLVSADSVNDFIILIVY